VSALVEIPDKMFFKIGEVAKITGVKPYILRYWESEFPHLRPSKGRSQHRLYRRKDVEDILRIKRLLYDEKFTIAGAKKMLRAEPEAPPSKPGKESAPAETSLVTDREALLELRDLVSKL
jgi:DNA-binding transcriptional MerR regulator